jgi:RNA polymerase sigma-70 factor (ECF subfamily)
MTPAIATAYGVDPYVSRQASLCASHLVRRGRFTVDDWDDLRQEMFLDLLQRLPRFQPERGDWPGFVRGVMRNRSAALATEQEKYSVRFGGEDGGCAPNGDENALEPLTDLPGEDSRTEMQLRLDVERVLRRLPEHLRAVALLLRDMSVSEICQHTGKSRSGINHFIRQIRAAFEEAGLTPERLAKRGGER